MMHGQPALHVRVEIFLCLPTAGLHEGKWIWTLIVLTGIYFKLKNPASDIWSSTVEYKVRTR